MTRHSSPSVPMWKFAGPWLSRAKEQLERSIDRPVRIASGCTVLLLLASSLYSKNFLTPDYLLQSLMIASFLGVVATGAMLVILIGGIDLSVPWCITLGGVMASASAGWVAEEHAWIAIPMGLACGLLVGVFNGLGVAYLRVPSMIFTLGTNAVAQGLVVFQTGGFAPQERATPAMHLLAMGRTWLGIPHALLLWIAVGAAASFMLRRTTLGRAIYAVGNRERAAYLSGIDTRRLTLIVFGSAGALSGLAGILLTGYSNKAYQGMGDGYLMPAIAAVVLGGTQIQGGKGSYLGTVFGVILITLLQSILSVMQIPELGRQMVHGVVILALLLTYGRGRRAGG